MLEDGLIGSAWEHSLKVFYSMDPLQACLDTYLMTSSKTRLNWLALASLTWMTEQISSGWICGSGLTSFGSGKSPS